MAQVTLEPQNVGVTRTVPTWMDQSDSFWRDSLGDVSRSSNKQCFKQQNSDHRGAQLTSNVTASRGCAVRHQLQGSFGTLSPAAIWACCKNKDLDRGIRIHNEIQKRGITEKGFSDALVTMYAQCGDLQKAQALLDKHKSSSPIPWTALITGYTRDGKGPIALNCFEQMQHSGVPPNAVTYACALKACALTRNIDKGTEIHDNISRWGSLEHNCIVGGALVDMYAKCGALCQARRVFENLPSHSIVSWSALITGYARMGQGQQALECFEQMQHEGILPDAVTYACILKACAGIGAVDIGKRVHDEILRQGLIEHDLVLANALVDMYAKCGEFSQAQNVLETLPYRNVVSWNALIAGYADGGQGQQAFDSFRRMQQEGIHPDTVTYVCILKACSVLGSIEKGKQIHEEILMQGLLSDDMLLGNALVDMYAKLGALRQAQTLLGKFPSRNTISWNSLIAGYAQYEHGQEALKCFEQMKQEGVVPDLVTFLCLLNVCCHLGLVEKGQRLFDSMEGTYGLQPDVECFTCMVDLLGRAGHLERAVQLTQRMPFSANSSIWHCLLRACHKWIDINVGTWAFKQAVELDNCDGTAYILMANIYSAAGMTEKATDIEAVRLQNKAWKLPGSTS